MATQKGVRQVGVDGQDVRVVPGCDVALENGSSNSAVEPQRVGGGEVGDVGIDRYRAEGDGELYNGSASGIVICCRELVVSNSVVDCTIQEFGLACTDVPISLLYSLQ